MNNNKTVVHCPECGSKKVKYLDDNMFQCTNCDTTFYVETNQTTVKHKHTYNNNQQAPVTPIKASKILLIVGLVIAAFSFIFIIPLLFSSKNDNDYGFDAKENTKAGGYTFDVMGSVPFIDASKSLKVFVFGKPNASSYENKKYDNTVFWAVYDPLKNSFDQINQLKIDHASNSIAFGGSCFRFDDGNVYFIYGGQNLFKYNVTTKEVQSLNEEIVANVKELKSGIKKIERSSHKFSAFDIVSNTNKEVAYFPISKITNTDNFDVTRQKQSYPNDKPATFFFQTDSEPSFLVKYNATYSMGYPFCFDPNIGVSFDDDENFVSASFSSYWVTASRLIDMKVLNTENKVYDMTVLDFRDDIVALGVKTNNGENDKFHLQWLDYNGNLLWSAPLDATGLYDLSGAISKEKGVLFSPCCEDYLYYNNKGKLVKSFKLEEIPFNLD